MNSIKFELASDVAVLAFSTDFSPSFGSPSNAGAYVSANPINPAGGLSDDSVDDGLVLISNTECSGEILRKGEVFCHPGILGLPGIAQLRFEPIQ